jgi:N-acetylglucosaminyldiphosphoundecaprenol N-acetyl-beta-D-mannosaminyltransferase
MIGQRETSVALFGIAIDNLTMQQVLDAVDVQVADGGFHQIATANVDFLINSVRDEELREALVRCDIVLADGMPLVLASRLLGVGLKERLAGADLLPELGRLSAKRGYRIFLLGAEEESSAGTAANLQRKFPGVSICGRFCPEYRPLEAMDHEEILSRIEKAKPDILLVAFGNPKQEKWLAMHRHRLKVPVCIGVGGSFDFMSGRVPRAPMWMQRLSLEWLYRMIQDPSRLAKRYAVDLFGLFRHLPLQILAVAMQSKKDSQTRIRKEVVGAIEILGIDGDLTGPLLQRFEADTRAAIDSGSHVVLDMSAVTYLGADALGSLIHLVNAARRSKRELWLAGLSPMRRWVIRVAMRDRNLRIATRVAEALRRLEPEIAPILQQGSEWGVCRIGGQMVPIHTHEIDDVYRQVQVMLKEKVAG